MNFKIAKKLALSALLFGSALCQSISLNVAPGGNAYWIAVDPINDGDATTKVELQDASSSTWTEMSFTSGWSYYQLTSQQQNGYQLPLSFRLTDNNGVSVTVDQAISSISGAADVINTQVSFSSSTETTSAETSAETSTEAEGHSSSNGNGKHNTQAPTQAPTHKATAAPTKKPTSAPATQAPSSTHKSTTAPTTKPTTAPTAKATAAPTAKATSAPTAKATAAPTTSGSSTDLCTVTSTSSEPLKILVPLYVDPGSAWDELITAAATGVQIIAIINPDNGPDSSPGSDYTTYMTKFKNAGIEMVGYVHTSYAARAVSDVIADIDTYASKYPGLSGIFVDECATAASDVSYYQQLYTHINGISGYVHDILNPGTQPDEGYVSVSSSVVIFEDVASNLKSNYASWVKCAPSASEKAGYKYKFTGIAYAASAGEVASLLSTMNTIGMGMVYVTDGSDSCCVYNNLASFFAAEAADVKALN